MLPVPRHRSHSFVMGLHICELITLLCTLHWTQHFFSTPTTSRFLTSEVGLFSVSEPVLDYQHEVWAIALGLNALLWTLLKSQVTLIQTELQSQPLSMVDWKRPLLVLFLVAASLAVLVVAHLMTT